MHDECARPERADVAVAVRVVGVVRVGRLVHGEASLDDVQDEEARDEAHHDGGHPEDLLVRQLEDLGEQVEGDQTEQHAG